MWIKCCQPRSCYQNWLQPFQTRVGNAMGEVYMLLFPYPFFILSCLLWAWALYAKGSVFVPNMRFPRINAVIFAQEGPLQRVPRCMGTDKYSMTTEFECGVYWQEGKGREWKERQTERGGGGGGSQGERDWGQRPACLFKRIARSGLGLSLKGTG